jgi:hypothetical protein
MYKAGILFTLLLCSVASLAQAARPTVYIEPQSGFETYLAAAISKKNAPVDVVTDRTKATYILKAAPVEIKSESTGGKIARCLFAYCAGIEDKGNVSVQLIESGTSKMAWAYSVNKQRGGSKNSQSMAEAVAKHLKDFVSSSQAAVQAAIEAATMAPAPTPAPPAAVVAPTPAAPTPVAYQQPGSAHLDNATQTSAQPVRQQESLGDAARRSKQRKACLELAKDNPSITCQ